ncbi:uncharacterized protein LOC118404570 [Branchiostoma floridae]|uniref:Uncharacterized protein LOC118404570 n=1 Tax=Branchiostoma floridae TaxID=7739 RepID=A0A9J7KHU4_BRAFL|nr:uncharacterized protein LOC118404570 [Branchiostoma floridae]
MSNEETTQAQQNVMPEEPVYQSLNPPTTLDVTYMGLQPPNRRVNASTQTQELPPQYSAPGEDQAYQPLSRETMEASSGYASLQQPTYEQVRSSGNPGEDDYENPDQGEPSREDHPTDTDEVTLDSQQDEYLEIVG